jgi:DNA-binding transcriptional LysR family regulator
MLKQTDYALLPALEALLDESNITRAAVRLGISQPSVSAKLTRLRDLLGDPLLVPAGNGRGMVLTPGARQLRPKVDAAMRATTAALSSAMSFDPQTSDATFRIVGNDNAAALTLTSLLAEVAANGAQGLRIALLRPNERSMVERLETGEADLAITVDQPLPGATHLHRRPIVKDRFATAQRKDHPRGSGPLDIDSFCAAGHLMVASEQSSFTGTVDDALRKLGRTRRVTLSIQAYALAPLIVAQTDLLTTLPRRLLVGFSDRLDLFEPPLDLGTFTPVALWHDRTHDDPASRWVRGRIFAGG